MVVVGEAEEVAGVDVVGGLVGRLKRVEEVAEVGEEGRVVAC